MTYRLSPAALVIRTGTSQEICLLGQSPITDMIDAIDRSIAIYAQLLDALQPNAPGRLEIHWRPTACKSGREPYVVKLRATMGDELLLAAEALSDRFFPLMRERRGPFASTSRATRVVLFQLQPLLYTRSTLAAAAKAARRKGRRRPCSRPRRADSITPPVSAEPIRADPQDG